MLIQATLVAIVAFLASVDEQLFGASMDGAPVVYRHAGWCHHG